VTHPVRVSRRALVLALAIAGLVVVAPPAGGADLAPRAAGSCRAGHVALTFDDGPSSSVTPRLVATLRRLHVPATFFMVGERVAASPATARLVERSGFLIANHTYRHEDLRGLSGDQIVATLQATDRALDDAGVHPTGLMRPPYGAVDAHVYAAIRRAHLTPVLWDVDPRDWEGGDADQIADRILGQLHAGSDIVLQHDGVQNSPSSVAAVPRVVAGARGRGFCFVALDERGRPGFPVPPATLDGPRKVTEGQRLRLTVTLGGMAGRATSVRLSVKGGRGDLGSYDSLVRVPVGRLSTTVTIPVRKDGLDERTERLRLSLTAGDGVRPEGPPLTVRVKDADDAPRVSGQPVSVAEPVTGTVTVAVGFALDHPASRPVRLTVQTVPGTADESDFTPVATTVRIAPGDVSASVPVTVHADAIPEGQESFVVRITQVSGATVAGADAVVTIDPAAP
jgi:peptidoglycan/xylan/chitin deacetylase (PgdA/CDA1 family)